MNRRLRAFEDMNKPPWLFKSVEGWKGSGVHRKVPRAKYKQWQLCEYYADLNENTQEK